MKHTEYQLHWSWTALQEKLISRWFNEPRYDQQTQINFV